MSLKVGTVCVGVGHPILTQYNGMECVIVAGIAKRSVKSKVTGDMRLTPCYIVKWANGEELASLPERIKPKRPPEQDMSWAIGKLNQIVNNIPATIS